MGFLQKVYYANKPLILANDVAVSALYPDYIVLEGAHKQNFLSALSLMDQADTKGVILTDKSKESLEKELIWSFYPIHSGGGIVRNESGDILMIYRRGKWDLPKGKQDEGESIEECAIREVKEETGISTLTLNEKIGNTLHIYPMGQQMILKFTTWFLMSASSEDRLQAQQEENIEQVCWVKPAEIPKLLQNSFENIRDVLKEIKIV